MSIQGNLSESMASMVGAAPRSGVCGALGGGGELKFFQATWLGEVTRLQGKPRLSLSLVILLGTGINRLESEFGQDAQACESYKEQLNYVEQVPLGM